MRCSVFIFITLQSALSFLTPYYQSSYQMVKVSMTATMPPPTFQRIPQKTPSWLPIPSEKSALESTKKEAESALPWKTSVSESRTLTYMPMMEAQLDVIKKLGMETVSIDEKFVYRSSDVKPARIGNLCFRNDKFRCVRLTYFDAGDAVQVFNSLWYPAFEYDIPLFGTDLISLGKGRILNVMDFQPLHPTEEYSRKYIEPLSHIRDRYPELQGVLSGKIYDDTSFFSKNMLFGRFTDESKVLPTVLPAFIEYLHEYVQLMDRSIPNQEISSMAQVKERQRAYDIYSALKDPAVGLFDAYFGKSWSKEYVHDFLFALSEAPTEDDQDATKKNPGPVHNYNVNPISGAVAIQTNAQVSSPHR